MSELIVRAKTTTGIGWNDNWLMVTLPNLLRNNRIAYAHVVSEKGTHIVITAIWAHKEQVPTIVPSSDEETPQLDNQVVKIELAFTVEQVVRVASERGIFGLVRLLQREIDLAAKEHNE